MQFQKIKGIKGASTPEYGLLVGLISITLIFVLSQTGHNLRSLFNAVNTVFSSGNVVPLTPDAPIPPAEEETTLEQFVFEIQGHYGSHNNDNSAVINELRFYTEDDTPLTYVVGSAYDSVRSSTPFYWSNPNYWSYSNLQDGLTDYTTHTEGEDNGTLFLYSSSGDTPNAWARFTGSFSTEEVITKIFISAGSAMETERRTPYSLKIYKVSPDDFDASIHIRTQSTDGLELIGQVAFGSRDDVKSMDLTF